MRLAVWLYTELVDHRWRGGHDRLQEVLFFLLAQASAAEERYPSGVDVKGITGGQVSGAYLRLPAQSVRQPAFVRLALVWVGIAVLRKRIQ